MSLLYFATKRFASYSAFIRFASYSAVISLTKKILSFGDRIAMNFRFVSAVILFFGKISVTTMLPRNKI